MGSGLKRCLQTQLWLPMACLAALLAGSLGCSDSGGSGPDAGDGSGARGGGDGEGATGGGFDNARPDAGAVMDAGFVNDDHFFINDDPPPFCGPDGGMEPGVDPGGSAECPADKNRQGCECDTPGEVAPCWPGRRDNRNHGQCSDGVTTCYDTEEFGTRWGPCEGYTLPDGDALRGPAACRCFSSGSWKLDNLAPCVLRDGANTYLHSSAIPLEGATGVTCPPISASLQAPAEPWSHSALTMDCGGQFRLCYTIRGGHVKDASADDCVVSQQCQELWYETAGERMVLPDIAGWISSDTACAGVFAQDGGYGEMSIQGLSRECDEVDDGAGEPFIFYRAGYCSADCQANPDADGCRDCGTSAAGDF